MAISPARTGAFDILLQVEKEDAYATELLHSVRYEKLSPPDHGLTTEIVMGVLRWRSALDAAIAQYSSIPISKIDLEVLTALRIAAYQFQFLERIPQRAAIHESVELVKRARKTSAAPFANAVLRKLSEKKIASYDENLSHPQWLVERWQKEYGDETTKKICEHDQQIPKTTIRIADSGAIVDLQRNGFELVPTTFLNSARRVASGDITKTEAFKQGKVAIQDEGSQLVALLAGKATRILDCCAAPGGKTRILAEQNPTAKIVAVELHEHRAKLLRQLVPAKNVAVVKADICNFPVNELYECVLADVPCSGTGTLARNPEIKWKLKADDLQDLQQRQLAILRAAMRQVAPGGRLIYSTCSMEHEENSEVVEAALVENAEFRVHDCGVELKRLQDAGEFACTEVDSFLRGPYLRTIPGVHDCDGFFAAVMVREANEQRN